MTPWQVQMVLTLGNEFPDANCTEIATAIEHSNDGLEPARALLSRILSDPEGGN